jgi:hypothetical protein
MNLKFIEKINSDYYIKKEIDIDDETDIFFTDIIKDDKIQNLKYFSCNEHDGNKIDQIILTYNYKFKSYDKESNKLIFEKLPTNKINPKGFLDFKNYIISKISNFYKQLNHNEETKQITNDLVFFLKDMDIEKFEYMKNISQDYDSIKITEYDEIDKENLIKIDIVENDVVINEEEFGKKYIFDMSIINELVVFNKSFNNPVVFFGQNRTS